MSIPDPPLPPSSSLMPITTKDEHRTPPPSPHLTFSSIASLRSALSTADETARLLLLSPDRGSSRTDGTGATGSTEGRGEATRSLVFSVDGDVGRSLEGILRDAAPSGEDVGTAVGASEQKSRASDVSTVFSDAASTFSSAAGSWDQALSVVGSPRMGKPFVMLPSPSVTEEDEREEMPVSVQEGEGEVEVLHYVKQESDDGVLPLTAALEGEDVEAEEQELNGEGLTNSQENDGLERNVTRSLSDFDAWRTGVKLAGGEGMSAIGTDDALSSIKFNSLSGSLYGGGGGSFFGGEGEPEDDAPPSPMLESEMVEFVEEELELKLDAEETLLVPVEEGEGEVVVGEESTEETSSEEEKEKVEEVDKVVSILSPVPLPAMAKSHSTLGWKVLTLALSAALAYSLLYHPSPSILHPALPLEVEEPPQQLLYVPLNESTVETIHFPTPIPLGTPLDLPAYALLATTVAALAALLPLVRRGYRKSAGKEDVDFDDDEGRRTRAVSPLAELNGEGLLEARRLLPIGVAAYDSRQVSRAVSTFSTILTLACGSPDKAIAAEWLGRTLFRLARGDGNNSNLLSRSIAAFERSIRLDPSAASPRASLGRAKYLSGDYKGAVAALRAALKRDGTLPFAHEWLAKSLAKVVPRPPTAAEQIEQHLLRAIELSPRSKVACRSHAFLGEWLHLTPPPSSSSFPSSPASSRLRLSRLALSKSHLLSALSLRFSYPAVHLRLAFLSNEALDPTTAAAHYRAACESRHDGYRDESLEVSNEAGGGKTPWCGWVFVTRFGSGERREVLRLARKEYPHDDLFNLLFAVEEDAASPSSSSSSSSSASTKPALLPPLLAHLQRRTTRYSPTDDLLPHGLLAVALLASASASASPSHSLTTAEEAWNVFWSAAQGSDKARGREEERDVAWITMAWYEGLRRREEQEQGGDVEMTETEMADTEVEDEGASSSGETELLRSTLVKKETARKGTKGKVVKKETVVAPATKTPTPARRTTRATSAAVEEQGEEQKKAEREKTVEPKEKKGSVRRRGKAEAARVVKVREEGEEGEKTPLRRSPRKVIKREEE